MDTVKGMFRAGAGCALADVDWRQCSRQSTHTVLLHRNPDACLQMAALAGTTSNIWRHMMASSPHFLADHILAVTAMALIYMAESAGVAFRERPARKSDVAITKLAALPSMFLPSERLRMLMPRASASTAAPVEAIASPTALPDRPAKPAAQPSGVKRTPRSRASESSSAFVPDRPARPGLKPGEWDPAQGFAPRKDIAKRTYLKDMYYCVAELPQGGLKVDKLYEAQAMSKKITYWQGTRLCSQQVCNIAVPRLPTYSY